jgi:hypothetical protein
MRKTRIHKITILNNLIDNDDLQLLRHFIDSSELQREEGNPNEFVNISDSRCNQILSMAQQKLKQSIEDDFNCSISNEGIGTVVKFSVGWELPYHCDQWSNLPTYSGAPTRDISSILYLSDDFCGGELEFPDLGITIEPCAGSAIYFTGTEEYMHRVNPVKSGSRLTCTGFWSIIHNYEHVSVPRTT